MGLFALLIFAGGAAFGAFAVWNLGHPRHQRLALLMVIAIIGTTLAWSIWAAITPGEEAKASLRGLVSGFVMIGALAGGGVALTVRLFQRIGRQGFWSGKSDDKGEP